MKTTLDLAKFYHFKYRKMGNKWQIIYYILLEAVDYIKIAGNLGSSNFWAFLISKKYGILPEAVDHASFSAGGKRSFQTHVPAPSSFLLKRMLFLHST